MSLWQDIDFGFDRLGRPVTVQLVERSMLCGGVPGAGKSGVVNLLTGVGALDCRVHLHLFDGKEVELVPWRNCAETFVGSDPVTAADALEGLVRIGRDGLKRLRDSGYRKVANGAELDLVVIDEVDAFLHTGRKALDERNSNALREILVRFRAVGMILVASTAKPSSDVISTSLRDLFSVRFALRCTTPQASDTILGSGMASAGFSAAKIDLAFRGVGFLYAEGSHPVLCRAYYLTDDDVGKIVQRAEAIRLASPLPPRTPPSVRDGGSE